MSSCCGATRPPPHHTCVRCLCKVHLHSPFNGSRYKKFRRKALVNVGYMDQNPSGTYIGCYWIDCDTQQSSSTASMCVCACLLFLYVCLCCLYICLSICLSISCLSACLSGCPFVFAVCFSVCLSVSACLSACLVHACLPVSLPAFCRTWLVVSLGLKVDSNGLFKIISLYLSVCLTRHTHTHAGQFGFF